MSIIHFSLSQLKRAAQIKEQIEKLQGELLRVASGSVPAKSIGVGVKPVRKKISATGIAKIRAAQKARWAKIKIAKLVKPVAKAPVKKKKMSAAAKAKLSALAKARWTKIKKAGKKSL
ncbi:MAG TPA: hypothetical protein VGM58_01445 [Verrucomicrobiae bacterium]|jgi:hypothetical protein